MFRFVKKWRMQISSITKIRSPTRVHVPVCYRAYKPFPLTLFTMASFIKFYLCQSIIHILPFTFIFISWPNVFILVKHGANLGGTAQFVHDVNRS